VTGALRAQLLWLGRAALSAVFVYAALPKLADPSAFATSIANYQLWPEASGVAALLVPVAELVIAAGLLVPSLQRGSALLSALLLAVFVLAMAQARARGIDLRCGCFNAALDAKVSWWTVARSGALCAFAWFLFVASRKASDVAVGDRAKPSVVSSS
jgi:uncharacterized membrane protein YphA (DoxX/SURF4 family)